MFTGLIEELGKIDSIESMRDGKRFAISSLVVLDRIKEGDSISINGVCLTVTKFNQKKFWCEAVGVTLTKSNLGELRLGDFVNLERALLLSDRLGGHIVQGHVNGTGVISQIKKIAENFVIEIMIDESLSRYIVKEGSICIDGISLTVADLIGNKISISVIPHTWEKTNLHHKKNGSKVNIETDIIAKYVERLLMNNTDENKFSDSWFKELGY